MTKVMRANRPFRLSTRDTRGLDGAGARVEKGAVLVVQEVLSWNKTLAMVEGDAGYGMAKLEWLEELK